MSTKSVAYLAVCARVLAITYSGSEVIQGLVYRLKVPTFHLLFAAGHAGHWLSETGLRRHSVS